MIQAEPRPFERHGIKQEQACQPGFRFVAVPFAVTDQAPVVATFRVRAQSDGGSRNGWRISASIEKVGSTGPARRESRRMGYDQSAAITAGERRMAMVTKLQEVEQLLSGLSKAEKAQVLQWVARDLGDTFPGIESVPGVSGGEPVIVRTRIPV